jgi:hypothetical protein
MDIVVDYIAVLAGAAVMFGVGALWYSPVLFGRVWMREMGFTAESMGRMKMSPVVAMAANFIVALITAYILYHFEALFGVVTLSGALELGFWLWLGFMAPIALHAYFWEGKSLKLAALNLAHLLVAICAGAAIIFYL